jgi:hypothetical protein
MIEVWNKVGFWYKFCSIRKKINFFWWKSNTDTLIVFCACWCKLSCCETHSCGCYNYEIINRCKYFCIGMQSAVEQSVLSPVHDKSNFPFLPQILKRQSLTQWACVHKLSYNSLERIHISENTSNKKRSVHFRDCSGMLLVPVYNVQVDVPCNTAVQLCVVNCLLDGTGELVSLCDRFHR